MLVVLLRYKVPLAEVDAQRPAHIEWLKSHYATGTLLASGPQEPRTGGVILMRGTRAEAERLVTTDPFAIHGIADYEIVEFVPAMTAPGLEALAS
ncbi:uncharacterized protein YciI [Sphingomonas kyeonggiensis]|uniref:Uncharacterized protein YciI n=1 Tax=Sphingomonas kyeonggiensis TaxID=1268553 RepID=A0A7W7K4X3_9SPHN|nr:YciI family protein [Sphingomonas kyeonggiensis]MBB4841109.1 uncharacterized protein YciI [Sphingomonas kyeonggiensis]